MDYLPVFVGFVSGGGIVGIGALAFYALNKARKLERRISELEAARERQPASTSGLPADVWSVVALLKLASHDQLDALTRLSPDAALAVVRELMPQLFDRRVG